MSGKTTRISLAQAGNGKTDWKALEALTEVQINARALLDPDTILPTAADLGQVDLGGRGSGQIGFSIHEGQDGAFRWILAADDGTTFAASPHAYANRDEAMDALRAMLGALAKADRLAA